MTHDLMGQIVSLCLQIDELAETTYGRLADSAGSDSLAAFWAERSAEERRHVSFWQAMTALSKDGMLPQIFEDPVRTVKGLQANLKHVKRLWKTTELEDNPNAPFLMAYRLEFYLLHPAYEILFRFARNLDGHDLLNSPEEEYEEHIQNFLQGVSKWGSSTPEMDSMGEMLLTLWRRNRQLTRDSSTDALTGLLNRRGFLHVVHPLAHLSRRNKLPAAVLMIDIDHFKRINDEHGHDMGDKVLRVMAEQIRGALRGSDVVGRWGGEEFVAFLYPMDPASQEATAKKVLNAISEKPCLGIQVTASIGAACGVLSGDPATGIEESIRVADANMYSAKDLGRNRAVCTTRNF